MERAMALCGNPSSVHGAGRAVRALIEEARDRIATLAGRRPQEVVFTSGGTEANWLALSGALRCAARSGGPIMRILVSAVEHDSVLANAFSLAQQIPGLRVDILIVSPQGLIDLDALRGQLRENGGRTLVCAMAANNETGVIQPLGEVMILAHEAGALTLTDAVQAAGKLNAPFEADYVSLSAHKIGGPQGVGALIVSKDAPFAPQILGGGQERGLRAGTENFLGVAGFGAAAAALRKEGSVLRDRFEHGLKSIAVDAVIFGEAAPRLANTSNFALPGVASETALMALDLDGVMVSSGAACSSGKVRPSHVLRAMGVSDKLARCALRVSFGWNSTEDDVDAALASLAKLVGRRRAREAA
jgi:cysteine desulfurase